MLHEILAIPATEDREKLFTGLYKQVFPVVAKYICKRGGTFEDAKDIFQDAAVICYEKRMLDPDGIKKDDKVYLMGVAKHLWAKKIKEGTHLSLDLSDAGLLLADATEQPASSAKILKFLEAAGKKCMELLHAFYYEKLPMKEVAEAFGFAGERSATVQKYKCLEKVRNTIREKSLNHEDFLE
jgi:RNA polymerase sigma factor (sigma-70 family)